MVELGFTAVASLAQTWDSAEPDEDDDGGKALASWKTGCATVAITLAELLQRAWLAPTQVCLLFLHREVISIKHLSDYLLLYGLQKRSAEYCGAI
jgi:hypothetical protein